MNTLFKIAFRNIYLQKRRTILSALTIAVGIMFFSMMDSVMEGSDKAAVKNLIELSTSSVKIVTKKYEEDKESFPLIYSIKNRDELEKRIKKFKNVTGLTERTIFAGQLSNYSEVIPVKGIVLNRETDEKVFSLKQHIEGKYFSEDNTNEIIIGIDLANSLNLKIGDGVTLYALTKYETRNADDFEIIGLINSTHPELNKSTIFMTNKAADQFLDLEGEFTELNVALRERNAYEDLFEDIDLIKTQLSSEFKDLQINTFMDLARDFLNIMESKRGFGYVFLFAILFIASVGIFNTVLMSVYERVREIGVLRAHGMMPKELTIMFMLEGFFTGLLGALLGLIISLIIVWLFVEVGYSVDQFAKDIDTTGMPIWGKFYGVWNIPTILLASLFSIFVSTVAAVIPARKASKMSVTNALRFF